MTLPIISGFQLNETKLYKASACDKICQVMSFAEKNSNQGMTRVASNISQENLTELFTNMLKCLQMSSNADAQDVIKNLAASAGKKLQASIEKKADERNDVVKISSKLIRDSSFEIDVSKDAVVHNAQKVHMVSCYMKDVHLGRYIIKRNYFYTMDREASADEAYDEILKKVKALKDRYHSEIIKVSSVTSQIKTILDGVISEIEIKEDSLGTTVNRHPYENS